MHTVILTHLSIYNNYQHLIVMSYPDYSTLHALQVNQAFLMHQPVTSQQQLHFIHAHRELLAHDQPHPNFTKALNLLPGSSARGLLEAQYLASLPKKERREWKGGLWQSWARMKQIMMERRSGLIDIVSWAEKDAGLKSHAEYILFLQTAASEILQILINSEKPIDIKKLATKAKVGEFLEVISQDHKPSEILQFLRYSLASTVYNMLLSQPHVPPTIKVAHSSLECLYANQTLQAHYLMSPSAATLLRILLMHVKTSVKQLKPVQQSTLLTTVMKYFTIFHVHKEHQAVELFIECYNSIETSVKYTLTSELSLFLRVAAKIGKKKMVEKVAQNSEWLKSLQEKVNLKNLVGFELDQITDRDIRFGEKMRVDGKKIESRWVQVFHPYSILMLRVAVQQQDITIKMTFQSRIYDQQGQPVPQVRDIVFEKVSGSVEKTIMMPVAGLYRIDIDNSYSWLNYKTVYFTTTVLNPLQMAPQLEHIVNWKQIYYPNASVSEISDQSQVQKYEVLEILGLINVSQPQGNTYHYHIRPILSNKPHIEYQTDSFARFIQRLRQVVSQQTSSKRYEMQIGGRTIRGGVQQIQEQFDPKRVPNVQDNSQKKKYLVEIPLRSSE